MNGQWLPNSHTAYNENDEHQLIVHKVRLKPTQTTAHIYNFCGGLYEVNCLWDGTGKTLHLTHNSVNQSDSV